MIENLKRHWNLKALRAFEACVRHRHVGRAADELCLTQSAVSKQIKSLEEGLGFALYRRIGKENELTAEGTALGQHLTQMFSDLEGMIDDLGRGQISSPLIVSCEPTLCLKLLIPALPEIEAETGLSIRVLSGGGPIDFRRDPVDLAIRRNDFPIAAGLHVTELGPELMGPVHAPECENLDVRLHAMTRPDAWTRWESDHPGSFPFTRDLHFEHHYQALEAAENGLGVAMMSRHMVGMSLKQKRLVAGDGFEADGSAYICLSRADIDADQRNKVFSEWLKNLLR